MNYLQWLTQNTPTKFWHDSAIPAEIDAAIENGELTVEIIDSAVRYVLYWKYDLGLLGDMT